MHYLGCIIGQIVGGLINDKIGYRSTCDCMIFVGLALWACYSLSNLGRKDFKRLEKPKEETDPTLNENLLSAK